MWPIVGIIVAFLAIFILVICKVNIGVSLILGAIVLGLFSISVHDLIQTILSALIERRTLELVATIISITFLNLAYQETGKFSELADSLGKMVSPKYLIAVIPIVLGVLPVSGGALFSAPLVDAEGSKTRMKTEMKAFINLWFRHMPHLLYPLETALVVASYLTQTNLTTMILYQIPIFISSIIFGYLMGLRRTERRRGGTRINWNASRSFLVSFSPILVAVILSAFFGVKVFIAVMIGAILLVAMEGLKKVDMLPTMNSASKMVPAAFGIMMFRRIVEISGALDMVTEFVQHHSMPPSVLLVCVPFLIGFGLGDSTPSITISLSILLTIYNLSPPATCLVYTCMYFGHLLSPLHLCFALSCQYFKTGILRMYKLLIPSTIATLSISIPLMILLI